MITPPTPTDKQREQLAQQVADTAAALERAKAARDAAIIAASNAGLTRRHVGELAGITYGRVQQIINNPTPPPPP